MGRFFLLGFIFSLGAVGADLPVDEDIIQLRRKADQLEYFKELLQTRRCAVQFSKSTVSLSAETLRSEGVKIAIGDNFPGNYLGFHNDLPPNALFHTIASVFKDNSKAENAAFFSATLIQADEEKSPSSLRVELRDPQLKTEQVDDDPEEGSVTEWQYVITALSVPLPIPQKGAQVSYRMNDGKLFKFECR